MPDPTHFETWLQNPHVRHWVGHVTMPEKVRHDLYDTARESLLNAILDAGLAETLHEHIQGREIEGAASARQPLEDAVRELRKTFVEWRLPNALARIDALMAEHGIEK